MKQDTIKPDDFAAVVMGIVGAEGPSDQAPVHYKPEDHSIHHASPVWSISGSAAVVYYELKYNSAGEVTVGNYRNPELPRFLRLTEKNSRRIAEEMIRQLRVWSKTESP